MHHFLWYAATWRQNLSGYSPVLVSLGPPNLGNRLVQNVKYCLQWHGNIVAHRWCSILASDTLTWSFRPFTFRMVLRTTPAEFQLNLSRSFSVIFDWMLSMCNHGLRGTVFLWFDHGRTNFDGLVNNATIGQSSNVLVFFERLRPFKKHLGGFWVWRELDETRLDKP
jgi:hypothetical protein